MIFLVEEATQNTLAPYFEFKDENDNVDVSYEKSYEQSQVMAYCIKVTRSVYHQTMNLAVFRLRFGGDYPKTKFSEDSNSPFCYLSG